MPDINKRTKVAVTQPMSKFWAERDVKADDPEHVKRADMAEYNYYAKQIAQGLDPDLLGEYEANMPKIHKDKSAYTEQFAKDNPSFYVSPENYGNYIGADKVERFNQLHKQASEGYNINTTGTGDIDKVGNFGARSYGMATPRAFYSEDSDSKRSYEYKYTPETGSTYELSGLDIDTGSNAYKGMSRALKKAETPQLANGLDSTTRGIGDDEISERGLFDSTGGAELGSQISAVGELGAAAFDTFDKQSEGKSSVGGAALKTGASGAAIGATLGGPLGAAIGGGAGLAVGAITAITENKEVDEENKRIADEYNTKASQRHIAPAPNTQSPILEEGTAGAGMAQKVEVERDELVLAKDVLGNYQLKADFHGGRSHKDGGEDYVIQEGDIVFPGKKRKSILDNLKRGDTAAIETERFKLPKDVPATNELEKGVDASEQLSRLTKVYKQNIQSILHNNSDIVSKINLEHAKNSTSTGGFNQDSARFKMLREAIPELNELMQNTPDSVLKTRESRKAVEEVTTPESLAEEIPEEVKKEVRASSNPEDYKTIMGRRYKKQRGLIPEHDITKKDVAQEVPVETEPVEETAAVSEQSSNDVSDEAPYGYKTIMGRRYKRQKPLIGSGANDKKESVGKKSVDKIEESSVDPTYKSMDYSYSSLEDLWQSNEPSKTSKVPQEEQIEVANNQTVEKTATTPAPVPAKVKSSSGVPPIDNLQTIRDNELNKEIPTLSSVLADMSHSPSYSPGGSDDFYEKKAEGKSIMKGGGSVMDVLDYAPAAANIIRGLGTSPEKVDRRFITPETVDYRDQSANARTTSALQQKIDEENAARFSGGSAQVTRAGKAMAGTAHSRRVAEIDSAEQDRASNIEMHNVGIRNQAEAQNLTLANRYDEMDSQNRAAIDAYFDQGIHDLGRISTQKSLDSKAEAQQQMILENMRTNNFAVNKEGQVKFDKG